MASREELQVKETPVTDIAEVVKRLRAGFHTHKTLDVNYRRTQLCNLKRLLKENKKEILDALWKDLRMSEMEATLIEHNFIRVELNMALDNLTELTAPKHQPRDLLNKMNSVYIKPEPYGVVLILSAWNLPFKLTLNPLIGAIAAGNCCLMKPSEVSVHSATLLAKLIPKYLDQECYVMVNGGVDVCRAVLKERFDYIMYTGGTTVGRIVMKAAAENITPLTLELGGKNPVIIASDANLEVTGRRIMFGRFLNCGQMCIAPDHIICMSSQRDKLIEVFKKTLKEFFGEDPKQSPDYGRIINERHFKRLLALLESTSGDVVCGGDSDESTLYIAPTVIANVSPDDKIMQEEIFGPLLPIITVESVDEAIKFVNEREKPLSMYVFTESRATFEKINQLTSAGGVCHNDTIMQAGVMSLPFGGVGHSGFGGYHGKHTFNTFSHYKSVLSTGTGLEALNNIRYPPYDHIKLKRLKWLLTPSQKRSGLSWQLICLFLLVAIAAVAFQIFGRGT